MTLNQTSAIRQALARYRNFEECLLREVRLTKSTTQLELEFGYIWECDQPDQWSIRDEPSTVVIRLHRPDCVMINARLPTALTSHPDRAGWGLTEVAQVQLRESPEELATHRLMVLWEDGRKIEVTFGEFEIEDPAIDRSTHRAK